MTYKTINELIKGECCNLVAGKCTGTDMSTRMFKVANGACWVIKDKDPCDYFQKSVLPLSKELADDYLKLTKAYQVRIRKEKGK